jgi:Protein of unknown function (DUF2380)
MEAFRDPRASELIRYEALPHPCVARAEPNARPAAPLLTRLLKAARRLGLAAALACWGASSATAADTPVQAAAPIRIAVFPFELDDYAAAAKDGETQYLSQATEEAKHQLQQSGRYSLVDTAQADLSAAQGQSLRNCNGCAASIAKKLGADQALVGVVTRISNTEYLVKFQVLDARTGDVTGDYATDLRMGADYSWSRGVRWLVQNRMLAAK